MSKYLGGCEELDKDFNLKSPSCCDSCHVDNEDYGYSLREIELDNGYYEVCCELGRAYDRKLRGRDSE